MAKFLWDMINGKKYAIAYNHAGRIEARVRSLGGQSLRASQTRHPSPTSSRPSTGSEHCGADAAQSEPDSDDPDAVG